MMMLRAIFAVPLLVLGALPATADEITLTSLDGDAVIRGTFAGYEAESYLVQFSAQEIAVSAALVTCEGVDCVQDAPLILIAPIVPQK